jgi:hypothetical protein
MKLIDENIKLKIVDNQKNGSLSKEDPGYALGGYGTKVYIIKSSSKGEIGYYDSGRLFNGSINIQIDNKVLLTKDNKILLANTERMIDLKTNEIYQCSSFEFNALKTNLSDRTHITLKNR